MYLKPGIAEETCKKWQVLTRKAAERASLGFNSPEC